MPTAQMVHPNVAVIHEIKKQMGQAANLLDHLPLDKVHIERITDNKKATTALPYKMHFSQVPNGRLSPFNIGILLCIGPLGGPPELRYKKIS
jgi:hypothetical protein